MSEPFRFLDLPAELRRCVYEHCFQGATLDIEYPNRLGGKGSLGRAAESQGAQIPALLLASKALRTETIPVYSKQLKARFFDLVDEAHVICHNTPPVPPRQVPAHYLQYTETAETMYATSTVWPDVHEMPSLKLLTLCYGVDEVLLFENILFQAPFDPSLDSYTTFEKEVVEEVTNWISNDSDGDLLSKGSNRELFRTGSLSFRVMAKLGGLWVDCSFHGSRIWGDITIDLAAKKIISADDKLGCGCTAKLPKIQAADQVLA